MFGPITRPLAKPFHKVAKDADLGRPSRTVTLPSGRTYRMSVVREPEMFRCPVCQEMTDDSDPCCGVGAKWDCDEVER